VEIQIAAGDGVCRISVCDRGPGIPPDVRDRVFEPFFTTRPGGTGLGLAIVKHILNRHRAKLRIHSELGVGSSFTVRVPVPLTDAKQPQ